MRADKRLWTIDEVLARWPELQARTAFAWAGFAHVLSGRSQLGAAATLARAAYDRPDTDERTRVLASTVLSRNVPQFHWTIVKDQARNDAYERALRQSIRHGDRVLDIGTGSGLLAMMAARAGADRVYACEMNPFAAALAVQVVAANGYDATIEILPVHSKECDVEKDLGGPVDLIVSEIVSNELLAEDVLSVHRDAVLRLLRPGGTVIPSVVGLMAALGEVDDLKRSAMGEISGFDLSAFDVARDRTRMPVQSKRLALRSEAVPVFGFDLARPDTWPDLECNHTLTVQSGEANCILSWLWLDMDGSGETGMRYENRPGEMAKSCWSVLVWPLSDVAHAGQSVRMTARYSDKGFLLWSEIDSRSGDRPSDIDACNAANPLSISKDR